MDTLAAIWVMAVVGSVTVGFMWFCWALSVWHLVVWERPNPRMAVPQWASSGTPGAFALFAATFVGLVALGLLAGHRDRHAERDAAESHQTSGADHRTSDGTP